jgi:hypothetical protein
LGLSFEGVTDKAGVVSYKQYVQAAGRVVMSITSPAITNPYTLPAVSGNQIEFLHHDHLGSLVMTTNEARAVKEQFLYDPWGKRLETTGVNFGEYSDSPGQANALYRSLYGFCIRFEFRPFFKTSKRFEFWCPSQYTPRNSVFQCLLFSQKRAR